MSTLEHRRPPSSLLDLLAQIRARRHEAGKALALIDADIAALERALILYEQSLATVESEER